VYNDSMNRFTTGLIFISLLILICGFALTIHGLSPPSKNDLHYTDRDGNVISREAPENELRYWCRILGPVCIGISFLCFGFAHYIERRDKRVAESEEGGNENGQDPD